MYLVPPPEVTLNIRNARKATIAAYRERKTSRGIFAVRCAPTGACWVGSSPGLDKIRNRIRFMLRQGGSPHPTLQDAWDRQGADAFGFEVLEELPEDVGEFARELLSERAEHWREKLRAQRI